MFWYLPLSSVKQAASVLENLEDITSADWDTKRQEIRDKHLLERIKSVDCRAFAKQKLQCLKDGAPCQRAHVCQA
jgi:hypothetical protein